MRELRVEKIVTGGLGLARDENGVILVEGALPDEVVLAEVRAGRGVRQARTREVLQASPDRVEAPALPTLDLAHARYEAQLRYKQGIVREALERIGKLGADVAPAVPSPQQWAYRNTAQYLVHGEQLAYRQRQGQQPVPIEQDPLVIDAIDRLLGRLDIWRLAPAAELVLRGSQHTGEVLVALIGQGAPRAYQRAVSAVQDAGAAGVSLAPPSERRFSQGGQLLAGEPTVLERYGRLDLSVSAVGFAQVNPGAAGGLYRAATELAGRGRHVVDLYGGAGGLGLHLAGSFERVTVLDVAAEALRRGQHDAARLGLNNVDFVRADAQRAPQADVIVVDPPRAGLAPEVREAVHGSGAARLVYVSCDPATWARDVGAFVREGWTLRAATPYDFYPQTSHVEVLSLLER